MDPKKILIVRPDAIGDVMLMIPLINQIKRHFQEARVDVLLQDYTSGLLHNHSSVNEVIIDWRKSGKAKGVIGFFQYSQWLKKQRYDVVIFSYMDAYYAGLMWVAGIPIRIGDKNRLLIQLFLNRGVTQNFRDVLKHEVEQNMTLLKGLKIQATAPFIMDLNYESSSINKAAKILKENQWKGEKLIGIHPTTGGGNRAWFPQKYSDLINHFQESTEYQVLITGSGKKDEAVFNQIAEKTIKAPLNIIGKTTVEELKGVLKHCDLIIGTDTGPTHMAAGLGVPVLCISPTKFVKSLRWGPWGTLNKIVGNPKKCPWICNPYRCALPDCLDAIEVKQAFNDGITLLSQAKKQHEVSIEESKDEWFRASMNIGILANRETVSQTKHLIEMLKNKTLVYYVLCKKSDKAALQEAGIDEIITYTPWNVRHVCRIINQKDITIVHLMKAYKGHYWDIIRQVAALRMYVPPLIVQHRERIDNIVTWYRDQFRNFYKET